MSDLSSNIALITLNVNWLTNEIKYCKGLQTGLKDKTQILTAYKRHSLK